MGFKDRFKEALSLGFYSSDAKSLRDRAFVGESYPTGMGAVGVTQAQILPTNRLFTKQNVRTLRNYAEFSVWVRAAIDIYRDFAAQAKYALQPADPEKNV